MSNANDREALAREMFPDEYVAITDERPMDPALVAQVEAELARGRRPQTETDDERADKRLAMHGMISQIETLARYMRLISNGHLSLAVVQNHGRTLREREGMGWHDAHQMADKIADGEIR